MPSTMKPYLLRRSADEPALAVRFRRAEDEALFHEKRAATSGGDLIRCGGLIYDLDELLELHLNGGFHEIFSGARDLAILAPGLELPVERIGIGPVADA